MEKILSMKVLYQVLCFTLYERLMKYKVKKLVQ